MYGGKVKNMFNLKVLGAAALLSAGLFVAGCKSAPELTQAKAQQMIQANYDQAAAEGVNITVGDLGLRQGITAKYWNLTKIYPNKYWADYTLTPDGKKAVKLPGGGDVIQWRPDSMEDKNHTVVVTTAAANHLKAKDLRDVQDEAGGGKTVQFTESVSLEGVPDALQDIAHNPGNKLSSKRTATFVLDGSNWKLQGIS